MNKTLVEIADLPGRFAEMLQRLVRGEEVVITENQVPRAKLIITPSACPPPDNSREPRQLGLFAGQVQTTDDFDDPLLEMSSEKPLVPELHPGNFQPRSDFDDPLPDEFWLGDS